MKRTIEVDDALLRQAIAITHIKKKETLLKVALEGLIARYAGMKLAELGGTMPKAKAGTRRRIAS